MRRTKILFTLGLVLCPMVASSEVPMTSYVAKIGVRDHATPKTKKYLTAAAHRVGQDRANYHRFEIRDQEDESDSMFSSKEQRRWLYQKLSEPGAIPAHVKRAIETGTPMVRVDVYGNRVQVSLIPSTVQNESPVTSYIAKIGVRDHATPTTKKYLRTAAHRIGQDRANYHRFTIRDQEDENDSMFSSKTQRRWLYQRLAEPGAIPANVKRAVANGTPIIRVDVYAKRVRVSLISR